MVAIPNDDNPAGVTNFDHRLLGHLPEYRAVGAALDALVKRCIRDEVPLSQERFLAVAADVASGLAFSDNCDECEPITVNVPYAIDLDDNGEGLKASYRCVHNHMWDCWWSLTAPDLF